MSRIKFHQHRGTAWLACFLIAALACACTAWADDTPGGTTSEPAAAASEPPAAKAAPESSGVSEALSAALKDLYIYGYFSTRFEKVSADPQVENNQIVYNGVPGEWSNPYFHLMLQQYIGSHFKMFVNINGDTGGTIDMRNMWGEYSHSDPLNVRMGKIYRKFGLYNEILDAVPTYFGIEPPELFDTDHLIISRTTNFMVYGRKDIGSGDLNYSLTTDNGEGGPKLHTIPIGMDVHYKFSRDNYTVGFSGYTSGGKTSSDVGLGEGSPKSGVLPWMASDDFQVYGMYAQALVGNFTFQGEYWKSPHDAMRDPASIVQIVDNANLSPNQLARFLIDPNAPATEANVNVPAKYDVDTFYLRGGYSKSTKYGQFMPYFQWDWYSNPETIGSKTWGGDAEAGLTDDGKFNKATFGIVYRPLAEVAIKLDGSSHMYKLGGQNVHYEEIRFDVSYIFGRF